MKATIIGAITVSVVILIYILILTHQLTFDVTPGQPAPGFGFYGTFNGVEYGPVIQ